MDREAYLKAWLGDCLWVLRGSNGAFSNALYLGEGPKFWVEKARQGELCAIRRIRPACPAPVAHTSPPSCFLWAAASFHASTSGTRSTSRSSAGLLLVTTAVRWHVWCPKVTLGSSCSASQQPRVLRAVLTAISRGKCTSVLPKANARTCRRKPRPFGLLQPGTWQRQRPGP